MLERILRFSIDHRWLVVMLTVAAAAVGVFSLQRLPIDAVPDITNNQVQINVVYPSLSPVEVEKQITFPVETALAGIPGLQSTRSLSRNGFAQITAIFEDGVDIYFARQQISERLAEARHHLPEGAEPRLGPIATGLGEVYMWTVDYSRPPQPVEPGRPGPQPDGSYLTPEGERLATELERLVYLRTVQDWIIRPQLLTVAGVAGVDVNGGHVKQYHVQADPMKLVSYGLTFTDLIEALERNNVSTGAGYVEHKGEAYVVRADGRIRHVEEIGRIVVGERAGVPVTIGDVAQVGVGPELRTGSASQNGREVVFGMALMLIGSNSRTVAADVDAKMQEIRLTLPAGIEVRTVLDRTKLVDQTIRTVASNLFEGAVLVIAVLFLLLGNIRAAVITALAIPLSMLMTATGMVHSRISGNLMSLGAIDFGLIVDGAVIIVENCLRHIAQRQKELGRALTRSERLQTVFQASKQVRSATAFGEAIIITVYIPILALTGVEGKMFHPMAWTVIFALAAAFVLSLTFIPAMVALGVTGKVSERENPIVAVARRAYVPVLVWALRLRYFVVAGAVVLFAASLLLSGRLGQEFIPTLDEHDIAMHAMRIPSTSLSQSTQMQFQVEQAVSRIPEVALTFSKTGTTEIAFDNMPWSVSDTFIILKPRDQWRSPAELDARIAELEAQLPNAPHDDHGHEEHDDHGHVTADITTHKGKLIRLIQLTVGQLPGNSYEFLQPIQMRFNELIAGVRGDVAVKVFGDDFERMRSPAEEIARVLSGIAGAEDVKVEQVQGLPVMEIDIDRDITSRYGLNVADVQEIVSIAIGGRRAGQVFEGDRRFDLVVRLGEEVRRDPATLATLPIPLPRHDDEFADDPQYVLTAGRSLLTDVPDDRPGFIPLASLADIRVAEGPNQVSRENGKRRMVVQCNVRGRDVGSFVDEARQQIPLQVQLPPGYWLDWGGQFENLVAAKRRLAVVVPVCFFLIFILLFSTFNSARQALVVFTAVPFALTGGIVALWLRDMPFSISAAVGFIALSGVAVLNGVVMITFINQLRQEGRPLEEAILAGAATRLRPVMMTALVASLGFVPMALATSTGAEVQRPLATVVIGGLISATILTLVVLPALYRIVERDIQR